MKARFEQILPESDTSFRAHYVDQDYFDAPFHYHPEIEITLILSGRGTTGVGDHIRDFGAMDLVVLGENLPHFYINPPEETGKGPRSRAEVLQFNRKHWSGLLDTLPEASEAAHLFDAARRGLHFPPAVAESAAVYMRELRCASGLPRLRAFIQLLELLSTSSPIPLASPAFQTAEDFGAERIVRACNLILERFDEDLRHEEVARSVHLSPAAFSRLFRRVTHQTYSQFLARLRLGHAGRLLIESELSVTEICYACGFRNLSNFNRRFKAHYGLSPRQYRHRAGSAQ